MVYIDHLPLKLKLSCTHRNDTKIPEDDQQLRPKHGTLIKK